MLRRATAQPRALAFARQLTTAWTPSDVDEYCRHEAVVQLGGVA
jgi:hypothetical protein